MAAPEHRVAIAVAVLAAGASTRLGRPKQALLLHGETLLKRSLRLARSLDGVQGVRVSVHLIRGAWQPAGDDLAEGPVALHHNPGWRAGRGSSLAVAARAAVGADGLLVLLCDQYRLQTGDLAPLLEAFVAAPGRVVASAYQGTVGAPVLWPARLLPSLAAGADPGRERLAGLAPVAVPVAAAAYDVDDECDVEALRRYERDLRARG